MYDIVIVGAGIAGLTAAIYGCRANKKVLVLESKVYGGQIINTFEIENWPGDYKVSGVDLMKKIYQQAIDLGAEVKFEEVIQITDNGEYKVVLGEEEEFKAKTVILAMGTSPRQLSDKQKKDAGERAISYCATCDGALYKGKPVVVVGSGNTAKSEMKYLENIASKVYHIHHDDPIPNDAVAVFVAIGRVPNTEFLKGFVELDQDGFVMAGEDCKTSRSGVFVAGDCRTKELHQLITASADGAVAASSAIEYLN